MKLFASIAKTEEMDDGTLKVWGYASSDAVDSDGETISSQAMKAAIPDYMKFGAVREMHGNNAAGTAIEAGVDDTGKTTFGAHVVDPIAVKKVRAGVYKGFSIGGKVTSRDAVKKTMITGLKLVEVSLVDRPANPDAVFTMYKAEKLEETPPDEAAIEKQAVSDIAELVNSKKILPSQILKAARDVIEPPAAVVPAAPKLEAFKKSMYAVSSFAQYLQSLSGMATEAQWETDYEGDGSKVPAQLRAWLNTGIEIFGAMAAEETAELMAALKPADEPAAVVLMADQAGDIAKAGAKWSAATVKAMSDIHGKIKECCDALEALGYKDADLEGGGKSATPDLTKAADPAPVTEPAVVIDPTPAAAAADPSPLTKQESAEDLLKAELAKRDSLINDLAKRLATIEAQPMPGKAVLRTVSKSNDIGGPDPDVVTKEAELPSDATPEQRALDGIKKSLQSGGRVIGIQNPVR